MLYMPLGGGGGVITLSKLNLCKDVPSKTLRKYLPSFLLELNLQFVLRLKCIFTKQDKRSFFINFLHT